MVEHERGLEFLITNTQTLTGIFDHIIYAGRNI